MIHFTVDVNASSTETPTPTLSRPLGKTTTSRCRRTACPYRARHSLHAPSALLPPFPPEFQELAFRIIENSRWED